MNNEVAFQTEIKFSPGLNKNFNGEYSYTSYFYPELNLISV